MNLEMFTRQKLMHQSYESLPNTLPVPIDDGDCDHLIGMQLPNVSLLSIRNVKVNLATLQGKTVIFCYPMTGVPGIPLPDGWDDIPGARGCTPQNLAYRDSCEEIVKLEAKIYGISTQTSEYQKEMAERLELPFPVLSDHELKFCRTLCIPTFSVEGNTLLKRVTIIAKDGTIEAVHYPVFPSDSDPKWVIDYLKQH